MEDIYLFLNSFSFKWSTIEISAVLLSIIYVILAAKKNIWCWVFSSISVIIYIYICFTSLLYAETALQLFYLFMSGYGFYSWKNQKKNQSEKWKASKHLLIIFIGGILTFFLGFYLSLYTKAEVPIIDSFTTIFSIIATYMVTKQILENWIYWVIIDLTSVYIYFNRDLHLTSLLFVLYAIIAVFGYFSWLKSERINA